MGLIAFRVGSRVVALIFILLASSGCSRPLTEGEAAVGRALFGDELDVSRVRLARGLGFAPPPGARAEKVVVVPREYLTCERQPITTLEQKLVPPAAFVLWNRIHWNSNLWRADLMGGYPEHGVPVSHFLILAHELVHVWQWQNRDKTGYAPWRAFREGVTSFDPYVYDISRQKPFAEYGYEQQARILEDWLCWRVLDPDHPKRWALERILAPHFPLERVDAFLRAE